MTVVASDNEANGYFSAKAMVEKMGGKGKVGILTTVYNSAYVIAAGKWEYWMCTQPPGAGGGQDVLHVQEPRRSRP